MNDDSKQLDTALDDLMTNINFEKIFEDNSVETDQVNVWVPMAYKERYMKLQRRTKKKFGKLLQEIVMRSIDKADRGDTAA